LARPSRIDLPFYIGWRSAAVVWIAGYQMGYRRGVVDAMRGGILKPDHRFTGD
jgi:hypothetical protein